MSSRFQVGQAVLSTEHPRSVGKILDFCADGSLRIEWTTPPSSTLPYGHIIIEAWPESDWNLLTACLY